MTKPPKKRLRVVGGHHRPPPPVEPSVPPAMTPEARTAFAEAIAAHLPGTWRLLPDQPDTITFDAEMCGTRRAWEWTVPVRLLRRDPQPGALLLIWTATEGGGTYGRERIVNPGDMVAVGVVTDAATPEALGKAIESANLRHVEGLWKWLNRHDAEYDHQRGTHHHGHGFTAAWVTAQLADKFLPQYLKALPKLRREAEKAQKAEAKARREREQQSRAAAERNIANGAAKLRALGYESYPSDPHTFYPSYNPRNSGRAPTVVLTGHHFNNYVNARVILRLSQLPALLRHLGHKTPRRKAHKKSRAT